MTRRSLASVVLALLVLASCSDAAAPPARESAGKELLPVYRTASEAATLGKADAYADFRAAAPGVYGITSWPAPGTRAAPEWGRAQTLLLAWSGHLPELLTDIVRATRGRVPILVLHDGAASRTQLEGWLLAGGVPLDGIAFADVALQTLWIRDFGPLPLLGPDGTVAFADLRYYPTRVHDDAVPTALATTLGVAAYRPPLVLEGGNFMADGEGACYMTDVVLAANPLPEETVRAVLKSWLGCERVLFLEPLAGEGTGHIDMFAKLVDPRTVVLGAYDEAVDATNAALLDRNAARLQAFEGPDGQPLRVVRMPMPSHADDVWRTYTNSLFVNGVNLVPVYDVDAGVAETALQVWRDAMPSVEHVPIDSSAVIGWAGAVHCLTATIPEGPLAPAAPAPTLLCNTSDCLPDLGADGPLPAGCDGIREEGCCDGSHLRYCDGAAVRALACGARGCGWNATGGYYDCGVSGEGPADLPRLCPGAAACVPSCEGRECGDDGCGGSCGACGQNKACNAYGRCAPLPPTSCGPVGYVGCCDGRVVRYCSDGLLETLDCGTYGCGWRGEAGFYDCGGAGSDPAGRPLDCP